MKRYCIVDLTELSLVGDIDVRVSNQNNGNIHVEVNHPCLKSPIKTCTDEVSRIRLKVTEEFHKVLVDNDIKCETITIIISD